MEAAGYGDATVVRLLLAKGADVKVRDKDGGTVLMRAVSSENLPPGDSTSIVRLLLASGADINARDKNGATALMKAVTSEFTSSQFAFNGVAANIVRFLLKRGAKVNARDKQGKTALMLAKASRNAAVERLIRQAGAKQ